MCAIFYIFCLLVGFSSCSLSFLLPESIFTSHKCFLLGCIKVDVVNTLRAKCHSRKKTKRVTRIILLRDAICIRNGSLNSLSLYFLYLPSCDIPDCTERKQSILFFKILTETSASSYSKKASKYC